MQVTGEKSLWLSKVALSYIISKHFSEISYYPGQKLLSFTVRILRKSCWTNFLWENRSMWSLRIELINSLSVWLLCYFLSRYFETAFNPILLSFLLKMERKVMSVMNWYCKKHFTYLPFEASRIFVRQFLNSHFTDGSAAKGWSNLLKVVSKPVLFCFFFSFKNITLFDF